MRSAVLAVVFAMVASACSGGESTADTASVPGGTTAPVTTAVASEADTASIPGGTTAPVTTLLASEADFGPDAPANPATVEITLQGNAASALVGPDGGTLTATGADGTDFTLTISEGALFSPVEITMTPIAGATGDVIGDTFIAGVDLQPDGLHFVGLSELTISGDGIDGTAVAWGAESGGGDFHGVPSDTDGESIVIPIAHFSDNGASDSSLGGRLEAAGVVPEGNGARVEALLQRFVGNPLATRQLDQVGRSILAEAEFVDAYDDLEAWSVDVFGFLARVDDATRRHSWTADTPGIPELGATLAALVQMWFLVAGEQVEVLDAACDDGRLESAFQLLRLLLLGTHLANTFGLNSTNFDADAAFGEWIPAYSECSMLGVNWQARILTTGPEFRSDINIGADAELTAVVAPHEGELANQMFGDARAPLEITTFLDFFANPILGCSPSPGRAEFSVDLFGDLPNLGDLEGVARLEIREVVVRVGVVSRPEMTCDLSGVMTTADVAFPFHIGALEQLNGGPPPWQFELDYEPGAGQVARFELGFPVDGEGIYLEMEPPPSEDPSIIDFGDVRYDLWQVVEIYKP